MHPRLIETERYKITTRTRRAEAERTTNSTNQAPMLFRMHSPLPDYAVSCRVSVVLDSNDQEDVLADEIPVTKFCDVEMSLNYQVGGRVTQTV